MATVPTPAARRRRAARRWGHGASFRDALLGLRRRWAIAVVMALYASSAFVVPTLAPIATTDDWGYTRSVEHLVNDHRLTILPVVAATAVFQVAWGALFATLFGMTFGVVRVSTVVMAGLGGLATYGLCRELHVSRGRSALGAAAYLFNPLAFVLAFTFMTDSHFVALLTMATYFYVRGLRPEIDDGRRSLVAGSAVAACAFLTRQQGALIPVGVVTYLLVSRRLRPDRAGATLLLRVVGLPVMAMAAYVLWLRFVNDVPQVQQSFFAEARQAGWGGTWQEIRHLTFFEAMYLGLFALPIVAGAIPTVRRLVRFAGVGGWLLFSGWIAILAIGLTHYGERGDRMPYLPQFFGKSGLGAPDVIGSRPDLLDSDARFWLTVAAAAGAVALALVVCRRVGAPANPIRARAGLVLTIGLWQVAGILPPSYHYRTWTLGSLDRYLLPLLPGTICLTLWALRDVRLIQPAAWVVMAGGALFALAGTRDYLVYMDAVWGMARQANAMGVDNVHLDAGSGWDGYHLYEYSLEHQGAPRTPNGPWWVSFYAPATDSTYLVAGKPLPGYVEVAHASYSSWLQGGPTAVFLLRRPDIVRPRLWPLLIPPKP